MLKTKADFHYRMYGDNYWHFDNDTKYPNYLMHESQGGRANKATKQVNTASTDMIRYIYMRSKADVGSLI